MKYNANFDKGSLTVYGFTEDYPLVESWEFLNNTSDACLFHGPVPDDWTEDFEARYPDEYNDISAFKVMHDWVVSTWQDGATGSALGVTYTGTDGKTYTTDTAEYRLAKFKKEEPPAPEPPKGPTQEELLAEIRDLLKDASAPALKAAKEE